MGTMAQLNVRLEPELKSSGDAVLDRVGISSTQIIRALWMKIARGAEALDQVVEVLAKEPAAMNMSAHEMMGVPQADPFEARLKEFYIETGLDPQSYVLPTEEEWEAFEAEDWHERECERLLYHAE